MIRFVGIDPLAEKILVVKSTIHYRAAFEPIAKRDHRGGRAGAVVVQPRALRVHARPTPIFPLDPDHRARSAEARRPTHVRCRGFTPSDFKVFDIQGFQPRMDAIRTPHPPQAGGGRPQPAARREPRIGGGPAFAHVAKHARRTVNPPEDTWVAFALDKRGYKKHCHFKVAVSRRCVRFLFEVGPEHADKKRWAAAWKRTRRKLVPVLRRGARAWPGSRTSTTRSRRPLADLAADAGGAARRRAPAHARRPARARPRGVGRGGRALDQAQYARAALETFRTLAPLYRLRSSTG